MARTFNRVPNIVDLPDKRSLKKYFFNQYNWTGFNDDKNFVAVDQNSFSSCENVYVDTEGVLRSRPYLKLKVDEKIQMVQVDEVWEFGPVNVYRKDKTLYFIQDGQPDPYYVTVTLSTTACKLIMAHNNIFIFEESSLKRYNLSTKTWSNADEFIYIPIAKTVSNGVIDTYESDNELTTSYYTRYLFNNANDVAFTDIYGKQVKMNVNGQEWNMTFKEGMQYAFMIDRSDLPSNAFADEYILGTDNDGIPLIDTITTPSGFNVTLLNTYSYDIDTNNVPNITWNMYWSLNDVEFYNLPKQDNIIGMPQLSKDGSMVCVLKSDGIYAISLVKNEYGTLTYSGWTKIYSISVPDHVTSTCSLPYNKNVQSSFVVKDDTTFAVIYSTSLIDHWIDNDNNTIQVTYNSPILERTHSKLLISLNGTVIADEPITYRASSSVVNNLLDTKYCNSNTTGIYTRRNGSENIIQLENKASYYRLKYDTITDTAYVYSIGTITGYQTMTTSFTYDNVPIVLKVGSSGVKLLSSYEWSHGSYFVPSCSTFKTDFIVNNSLLAYSMVDQYGNTYIFENNTELQSKIGWYSRFDPSSNAINVYYLVDARLYNNDEQLFTLYRAGGSVGNPVKLIYYDGQRILLSGNNKLKNNNLEGIKAYADVLTSGTNNYFIPDYYTELNEYYLSKGNVLYISETKDTSNFKWYLPKKYKETLDYDITNLHVISTTDVAIFQKEGIMYVSYQDENYRLYKSRVDIGLKEGSDVITTYDGKYTIFNTERGLVAMSYQEFVASTEQALTYISDKIFSHYELWVNNDAIKLCRYKYWIIAYKTNSQYCLVFDLRNNSWWPFKYPYLIQEFVIINDELVILLNKCVYTNNKDDETIYMDYLDTNINIDWFIKSQKLHLDAINYYKEILAITLNNTFNDDVDLDDDNRNKKKMKFKLKVKLFRTDIGEDHYGSIVQQGSFASNDYLKVIDYDIDCISTFVQRVNFMKVLEFQFEIYNPDDQYQRISLSLANVTVKYKIGNQVR